MNDVLRIPIPPHNGPLVPRLENGDRLSRAEFERRYAAMPPQIKAELIEGVVHLPSPVSAGRHGSPDAHMVWFLTQYCVKTPGTEVAHNATVRLDLDNEPQPDATLYVVPGHGGQVRISADDYIEGAPELVAEVSSSSVSIDLGPKMTAYRRNGVREYIVWRVLDGEIDWFGLKNSCYERLPADSGGTVRSEVFPGLWLDRQAMVRRDLEIVEGVLGPGLASVEHSQFIARLRSAHRP